MSFDLAKFLALITGAKRLSKNESSKMNYDNYEARKDISSHNLLCSEARFNVNHAKMYLNGELTKETLIVIFRGRELHRTHDVNEINQILEKINLATEINPCDLVDIEQEFDNL